MKKSVLFFTILLVLTGSAYAQIMNVHLKDGNVIPVPVKDIEKITYDMESTLEGKKAELVADPIIREMMQLAVMAQQYYRKPVEQSGGGNSFKGWTIPELMQETPNGTIKAKVEENQVTLTGTSKTTIKDNKPFRISMIVEKDKIKEATVQ